MSVVEDARDKGVHTILAAGGSAKDNVEVANLAKMPGVFAVVGISPDFLSVDGKYIEMLRDLVKSTSGVVGIGEIGLDTKALDVNSLLLQKEAFEDSGRPGLRARDTCRHPLAGCARPRSWRCSTRKRVREGDVPLLRRRRDPGEELADKGYLISIPPAENARRGKRL